jgi:hypothetical protein
MVLPDSGQHRSWPKHHRWRLGHPLNFFLRNTLSCIVKARVFSSHH